VVKKGRDKISISTRLVAQSIGQVIFLFYFTEKIKNPGPEDRVLPLPPKRGLRRRWVFSQGHISEEIPLSIAAVQYLGFTPMNPLESAARFLNPKYWAASY